MSRIIAIGFSKLALALVAATIPASAASSDGANVPHILLVAGGGHGGGGHGGGFGGGGHGGGFSGGFSGRGFSGRGFSGSSARAFSSVSPSFSAGARSFNGDSRGLAGGNRSSFDRGRMGFDGFERGGWNRADFARRGRGGDFSDFDFPLLGWFDVYDWWYPGYYLGLEDGNYSDYGGTPYPYLDNGTVPQQSNAAMQPPRQTNPTAENGQGNQYLDEALQSFQAGNYQNAMRMAEHAIVDLPRDAEAHEVVSLAAFANKDYRTAATEAHAVAALGGVPSWNQVYAIYQNADAYTLQLRSLEDYVNAHPQSADGQFLLGIQYLTTGYASDAHERLAKAAELAPKDKIVQNLMEGAAGKTPMTATRMDATAAKK